ncbi:hypothetical protein GCM10027275_50350 [Rhabdobacter roseus]|uniref:DUF5675 domain-containing protein n=1 Tax=Rhabdobacter roseus TaxID=1655419 RepID=A0A840U449_9BACT|nr:DUF5675 family protein [Rhabdobacter roseus]MBB5287108.1 hypothetical protein [Rhabdobacter roseus]
MEILVKRVAQGPNTTLGHLYIDGVFECYTLEDTDRGLHSKMTLAELLRIKLHSWTCIPTGRYKLGKRYSPAFKRILPWLLSVLGFEYIYFHSGNKHEETKGCLLTGTDFKKLKNGDFYATDSRPAFNSLWEKMEAAWARNEEVWCAVEREYIPSA